MSAPASSHSAFRDGFAALWHEPVLLAAELTWRWCFGLSAWLLVVISGALFLDSLKISPGDEFLLGTLQPQLFSSAVRHIFRGSLTRLILEQAVLLLGLLLLWAFAATAGRAATLRRLVDMFRREEEPDAGLWEFRSIFTLQLLRAMWSLIALAVTVLSLALGVSLVDTRPVRAAFFLSFGIVLGCVFGVLLNWFLGLAPLFCIRSGSDPMQALAQAIDFTARRTGRLSALGVGFLLLRLVWTGTMLAAILAPLQLSKHLVPGGILLLMAMMALVYFAGVDLLYLARLGAYASLAEEDAGPEETAEPYPELDPVQQMKASSEAENEFGPAGSGTF